MAVQNGAATDTSTTHSSANSCVDDAEFAEWMREWGQVTPLPLGGLRKAVSASATRQISRPTSENATRCDRPSIQMIVELDLDDIADADEVLPDAAAERPRDAR